MPDEMTPDIEIGMLLRALRDPQYDWRTIEGLHRTTKIPPARINTLIAQLGDMISIAKSSKGVKVFRLAGGASSDRFTSARDAWSYIAKRRSTAR